MGRDLLVSATSLPFCSLRLFCSAVLVVEMNEEGGEELEEETWLEEMKPGMVLFWQVQTFPADLPSAPVGFFGVSFISPSRQGLPRGLWADQKS